MAERYQLRDAKGRFVKATSEEPIFKASGGRLVAVERKVAEAAREKRSALPDIVDDSTIVEDFTEDIEIIGNRRDLDESEPLWKSYKDTSKPRDIFFDKDGNVIDRPFEFSYRVQQRLGLNKDDQKQIFELFKEANKAIAEIREATDAEVGRAFSYNLETTAERLQRRMEAARDVLSGNYIQRVANQYKVDFLENFKNHLEPDLFARLLNAINSISDLQFLQVLKNTRMDSIAYSLDSVIDQHGYDMIIREVNYIIDRIREGAVYS